MQVFADRSSINRHSETESTLSLFSSSQATQHYCRRHGRTATSDHYALHWLRTETDTMRSMPQENPTEIATSWQDSPKISDRAEKQGKAYLVSLCMLEGQVDERKQKNRNPPNLLTDIFLVPEILTHLKDLEKNFRGFRDLSAKVCRCRCHFVDEYRQTD